MLTNLKKLEKEEQKKMINRKNVMLKFKSLYVVAVVVAVICCVGFHGAQAAEVPEGTVLTADNLDKYYNDTWDGYTIKSMLTERLEWQIRKWGLTMPLSHYIPMEHDVNYVAATKKYSKDVKYDPKTKIVSNYKAGLPFPDISEDDPEAGYKLLWNFFYAPTKGDVEDADSTFLLIDAKGGLERLQLWHWYQYRMKGRVATRNKDMPIEGDGTVITRHLFVGLAPYDIKGVGMFSIHYDTGQLDDSWAYVKSVRRTRRLSGGSWMDPLGGHDQLVEDAYIFNCNPRWYKDIKLIGKRRLLAVTHDKRIKGDNISEEEHKRLDAIRFKPDTYLPSIDLKNYPHWNIIANWEPREVYVIEATPPDEHPYSKKIIYMDTEITFLLQAECYDKKGDFWKFLHYPSILVTGDDGYKAICGVNGIGIDFKRLHSTQYYVWWVTVNRPGVKWDDFTPAMMVSAGR